MTDYATALAPDTVRIERTFPGPIERLWAYLTESDKREKWLASGEMDLREGGSVQLTWHNSDLSPDKEPPPEKYSSAEGHTITGRVLNCDPPRLLTFSWGDKPNASEVTFELTPEAERVRLAITHRRLDERAKVVSVSSGWHVHLAILEDILKGDAPRPFWSNHARIEAEYERRL